MKAVCGTLATVLLSTGVAHADTHCYAFRNDSSQVMTLAFSYQPAIGNVIVGVAIDPGKTYPFDGRPWCWNLPDDVTATVAVSGSGVPQWKGALVLGNRSGTAPSGTYAVGAPGKAAAAPAAAAATGAATAAAAGAAAAGGAGGAGGAVVAAPAAKAGAASAATQCIANSFPNSDTYCLMKLESRVELACGLGHTGISGNIVVDHLTVQCRNGRKLRLTCGTTTGGRQKCNLNDQAICTDDRVRNAADYCAH